jgi:hypothetical protein
MFTFMFTFITAQDWTKREVEPTFYGFVIMCKHLHQAMLDRSTWGIYAFPLSGHASRGKLEVVRQWFVSRK